MDQPLVSICIPSYNNEAFVEETIASVFNQSYRNIEVLITDDGSTDTTVACIEKAVIDAPFPIVVKVAEKNAGIEANWNQSLQLATGKYIKLLPADDVLFPECITEQVTLLESSEELSLVFCARQVVTASGTPLLTARFYKDQRVNNSELLKRCILSGTNVIGEPGAVLFRKSIADEVGWFDGKKPYVIDLNYWIRLLNHGHAIAIEKPLCTFRIDNNLSVRLGFRRFRQYIAMIDEMQAIGQFSPVVVIVGKCRALLNEFLRRIVHLVFRFVG